MLKIKTLKATVDVAGSACSARQYGRKWANLLALLSASIVSSNSLLADEHLHLDRYNNDQLALILTDLWAPEQLSDTAFTRSSAVSANRTAAKKATLEGSIQPAEFQAFDLQPAQTIRFMLTEKEISHHKSTTFLDLTGSSNNIIEQIDLAEKFNSSAFARQLSVETHAWLENTTLFQQLNSRTFAIPAVKQLRKVVSNDEENENSTKSSQGQPSPWEYRLKVSTSKIGFVLERPL